jgi:hypothetical protein
LERPTHLTSSPPSCSRPLYQTPQKLTNPDPLIAANDAWGANGQTADRYHPLDRADYDWQTRSGNFFL